MLAAAAALQAERRVLLTASLRWCCKKLAEPMSSSVEVQAEPQARSTSQTRTLWQPATAAESAADSQGEASHQVICTI